MDEIILESPVFEETPDNLDDTLESTAISGVIDVVDGNESYNTRFLYNAMAASGLVNFNFDGNESVWDSVKSGFSKAITYISNLFKSIWNFLFGKESEAEDTKEETALKAAATALSNAGAAVSEKASGVKAWISEAAEKFLASAKASYEKIDKQALKDKMDAAGKTAHDKLLAAQKAIVTKSEELVSKLKGYDYTSASSAAAALVAAAQFWAGVTVSVIRNQVKSVGSATQSQIDKLTTEIRGASEEAKARLTEQLASLREVMKSYTEIQSLKSRAKTWMNSIKSKLTPSMFKKAAA